MKILFQNMICRNAVVFVLLAALVLGVYAFMLRSSFKVLDDQTSIVDNPQLRSLTHLKEIFTSSFFGGRSYYRPLVTTSFLVEYQLFRDRPFMYYLDNILLHILTSFIVFLLLTSLLEDRALGFWAALLYALHPIHWEAVSNIPGRSILLCGLFVLLSFYLFIKTLDIPSPAEQSRPYLGSLICFALALLSKESAGMLPFVLWGYLIWRYHPRGLNYFSTLLWLVPYFCLIGTYVYLRKWLGVTQVFQWAGPHDMSLGFLSFLRGILTYLRLFIWPTGLYFDRSRELWTSYARPEVWLTLAVWILGLSALWRYRKKMPSGTIFFVFWFLAELFPVSQVVSSVGIQPGSIALSEHFLYVAAVPLCALFTVGIRSLSRALKDRATLSPALGVCVLGAWGAFLILTTAQQVLYSSQESAMFKQSLAHAPHNTRMRYSYALSLARQGLFAEAEPYFREIIEQDPRHLRARIALGKALCDQGRYWEGIREYEKALPLEDTHPILVENLRRSYAIMRTKYEALLREQPDNPDLLYTLGVIYSQLGQTEQAVRHFEAVLRIDPEHKQALFNLGSIMGLQQNREKAVEYYTRMIKLKGKKDNLDVLAERELKRMENLIK